MRTLEGSHGCDPMWSHKGCFHYFGDGTFGHMSDVVMGLSTQGAFQQLSDLVPGAFEGPLLMHGSRATALYQAAPPLCVFRVAVVSSLLKPRDPELKRGEAF